MSDSAYITGELMELARTQGKIIGTTEEDGQTVHVTVNPNESLEREKNEECLATWYHQATPGTTYWRCVLPARYLPGQAISLGPRDATYKKSRFGRTTEEIIFPRVRGDAVIWQFLGDELRTKFAFGVRELTGTKLILETDDNYLREAPYQKRTGHSTWKATAAEAKGGYSNELHRHIVPLCDAVICSTNYLADAYSDFNDNVYVCPNSVDPVDWKYEREPHDKFRIAYYGSPSHTWDTPLVTKALKWASKQPDVEVWLVGFKNASWSFEHQQIPWIPWLDIARQQLFKFDLGIAPLKENKWAAGKSDVKGLEYAMAGVMPLMSDATPYNEHWEDQYLVSDDEWEGAIRWAVECQDDVRFLAQRAKEYVLRERTIEKNIHLWREAIGA